VSRVRPIRLILAAALVALAGPAFAQPASPSDLAVYQGADREQLLIDGAKREGSLTLYTSMQLDSIAPLQKAFEAKYGVKIVTWRGSGKDILSRAVSESAANRNDVDIMESDGFALEALYRENVLLAVKSPYLADLTPEAVRPHGQWVERRLQHQRDQEAAAAAELRGPAQARLQGYARHRG
jgi:iron(III) transport system substrate-binding protein